MSQAAVESGDVTYYATTDGEEDTTGTTSYQFASFSANKGTANYSCTADLTITVTGGETLKAGDAFIDLVADGFGEGTQIKTEKVDLKTIVDSGYTKSGVQFDLTGTTPKTITGKVGLVNKQQDKQDYLANLNLKVSVKVDLKSCEVAGE